MIKLIKMTAIFILSALAITAVGTYLFMSFHPVFGGKPSKTEKDLYATSANYKDGIFVNSIETNMTMSFKEGIKLLPEYFGKHPGREPQESLPVINLDSTSIQNSLLQKNTLTWFGHSAFLMTLEGKKVLIDPMFGETPSPVSFLGSKRYSSRLPLEIEKLPTIDLVLFSHDHYDHLDYHTILKIKDKVTMFYVPLGLGAHLKKWGVEEYKIKEFDWWQEDIYMDIQLACTPARHFSGRGFSDRFSTLWASWVIKTDSTSIYFSGDSGFGPHFKSIGEKYGPFDITMMECGQYNERWDNIHMMPEETIQAGIDVKANTLMPIHWGAFTLALHPWQEPVQRALAEAKKKNVQTIVPQIGESFEISAPTSSSPEWWKSIK